MSQKNNNRSAATTTPKYRENSKRGVATTTAAVLGTLSKVQKYRKHAKKSGARVEQTDEEKLAKALDAQRRFFELYNFEQIAMVDIKKSLVPGSAIGYIMKAETQKQIVDSSGNEIPKYCYFHRYEEHQPPPQPNAKKSAESKNDSDAEKKYIPSDKIYVSAQQTEGAKCWSIRVINLSEVCVGVKKHVSADVAEVKSTAEAEIKRLQKRVDVLEKTVKHLATIIAKDHRSRSSTPGAKK
jgi:hypothetical protein